MSRPYFVIDGYNLMHAAGMARRRYAAGQLERARTQLLRFLSVHLTSAERARTTIVFDAADAPADLPRQLSVAEMTVCFASPGKDADGMIEEMVAAHSAPRQIRLISSDHRLQRSVRKRRGSFVDSEDFVQELERRGRVVDSSLNTSSGAAQDDGRTQSAAATDADEWLRIFSDIPEAAELADAGGDWTMPIDQADVRAMREEIDQQENDAGRHRRKGRPPKKN